MFVVAVKFSIQPEKIDAFMPLMLANARLSLEREPGCRRFDVCAAPDDRCAIFLYEVYDDEAAFDAHRQMDHYKEFGDGIDGMVAAKEVQTYALLN